MPPACSGGTRTGTRAQQLEFLTIIEEEADHLGLLLENMLESARLQSRTAKFACSGYSSMHSRRT